MLSWIAALPLPHSFKFCSHRVQLPDVEHSSGRHNANDVHVVMLISMLCAQCKDLTKPDRAINKIMFDYVPVEYTRAPRLEGDLVNIII